MWSSTSGIKYVHYNIRAKVGDETNTTNFGMGLKTNLISKHLQ